MLKNHAARLSVPQTVILSQQMALTLSRLEARRFARREPGGDTAVPDATGGQRQLTAVEILLLLIALQQWFMALIEHKRDAAVTGLSLVGLSAAFLIIRNSLSE